MILKQWAVFEVFSHPSFGGKGHPTSEVREKNIRNEFIEDGSRPRLSQGNMRDPALRLLIVAERKARRT